MVNKKRLIALTQKLIGIDSQNPPGNETHIAEFVRAYLAKIGLKARLYEFQKGRANVVAVLEGAQRKKSLLVTPHLDTVPAGTSWHYPPLAGTVASGRLYGLGATDCKGNLASGIEALHSLIEDRHALPYDVIFAATADEEAGSEAGLIPLLAKGILKPDAALVLDADDYSVVVAQKGLIHFRVRIRGKKAHGAYPWRGKNAIDAALAVIGDLHRHKFSFKKNTYLHPPTLNTGTIKGGDKVNVVADWCVCELDLRFLPGQHPDKILSAIRKVIRRHTRKFTLEIEGIQKPYVIAESHPLVEHLCKAMRENAVEPRIEGSEGATTISFFQDKRIPATATGFGTEGCAHIADEYAKIDHLYKGAMILETFFRRYAFK
ncbi:MAG TPA: M20 family metallopeptidase [Patescibacteria group bacterium]|nr:M20 family metallopeptidase [Patescibacteria group bacterium]